MSVEVSIVGVVPATLHRSPIGVQMIFSRRSNLSGGEEHTMRQPGPLVLCVDDEKIGLQVRKILLERSGYTVLTAPDGPSGLDLFAANPVEAVVLDYSMPGMHGGEVAARMRERKPDVPILLLSAYLGLPTEITKLVNVYMTKGEGAPALLDKLGSFFGSPE